MQAGFSISEVQIIIQRTFTQIVEDGFKNDRLSLVMQVSLKIFLFHEGLRPAV